MSKVHVIPKRAGAGVEFLGVNFEDTLPFLLSILVALGGVRELGALYFFICLGIGYITSKLLILWKDRNPNGAIMAFFYEKGWFGYSKAFNKQNKIFVGTNTIENIMRQGMEI